MTQAPGCPQATTTRYLMRSLLRNRKAAAWAWQSASRSSNRMAAGSGPTATTGAARRSTLPCRRPTRKQTLRWMPRDLVNCRRSHLGGVEVTENPFSGHFVIKPVHSHAITVGLPTNQELSIRGPVVLDSRQVKGLLRQLAP